MKTLGTMKRSGWFCAKCGKTDMMTRMMRGRWWSVGCTHCRWTVVYRFIRPGLCRKSREMYV